MVNEEAQIKIRRARISLQRNHPFFAYLSLFLKPLEIKTEKEWGKGGFGMGVAIDGTLAYNPDFVNSLSDAETQGVICHEILHLAFLHIERSEKFNKQVKNISDDVVVNEVIKDNNFTLPKGVIWSNNKREVKIENKTIKDANKKISEEIYWEIYDELKNQLRQAIKRGDKIRFTDEEGEGIELDEKDLEGYEFEGSTKEGEGKVKNFDSHINNADGKLSKEQKEKLREEWINRTIEASQTAKMVGKEPVGINRIIGKLHENKINWKVLLQRYIQNSIPHDFTYARPNKKSISSGYYLPDVTRERIEVGILIDTSGSIGSEELSDFLSEIVGMARAYREKIKMNLACHEVNLTSDWVVENGNVQKILDTTKIKGGGGTCFAEPYEQFMEKYNKTKLLIWLTDGYGDKIERKDLKCDIVWILSKGGSDNLIKEIGKVIKLAV